jgi:hypothetical protein
MNSLPDSIEEAMTTKTDAAPSTPSAEWRANGEPDPHGKHYDCERAALTLGNLTDDELANEAFLNYDKRLSLEDMLHPKPGRHMPIVWMTAVKERIRWLSRALERALAAPEVQAGAARVSVDYDRVVSICEAHGIGLPVDCVEMVVEIIRHAASSVRCLACGATTMHARLSELCSRAAHAIGTVAPSLFQAACLVFPRLSITAREPNRPQQIHSLSISAITDHDSPH